MKSLLKTIKMTLIGGVLFLLPLGIVLVVFGRLFVHAQKAALRINDLILPGMQNEVLSFLIAIGLLLVLAMLAGAFVQTKLGVRLFSWLEEKILGRIPVYTLARQMLGDLAGGSGKLASGAETQVVMVRLDEVDVIGFLVDTSDDGRAVVFLPGAPSALSGSVALVPQERIIPTKLTPTEVMGGMRRLGAGLTRLGADSR